MRCDWYNAREATETGMTANAKGARCLLHRFLCAVCTAERTSQMLSPTAGGRTLDVIRRF